MNNNKIAWSLILFTVLAVLFYLLVFVGFGANSILPIPVFGDDYFNYSYSQDAREILTNRPVSSGILYLLARCGPKCGPDICITTIRILFVTYFILTGIVSHLIIGKKFLYGKSEFFLIITVAFIVMCYPMSIYYGHYTGLITNLLAGTFGLLSIIYFYKSLEHNNWKYTAFSAILLLLSALSKEDFVLAVAAAVMFSFIDTREQKLHKKYQSQYLIALAGIIISLLTIAFFKYDLDAATMGMGHSKDSADPYYFSINPVSIIRIFCIYMNDVNFELKSFQDLALILGLVLSIHERKNYRLLVIFSSLIITYTVLPNHAGLIFYQLNWLPFLYYFFLISANNYFYKFKFGYWINILVCIAIMVVVYDLSYRQRNNLAGWYQKMMNTNEKFLNYLVDNKTKINQSEYVCIRNPNYASPWHSQRGDVYLRNALDLHTKWLIFIPKDAVLDGFFDLVASNSSGNMEINPSYTHNCLEIDFLKITK